MPTSTSAMPSTATPRSTCCRHDLDRAQTEQTPTDRSMPTGLCRPVYADRSMPTGLCRLAPTAMRDQHFPSLSAMERPDGAATLICYALWLVRADKICSFYVTHVCTRVFTHVYTHVNTRACRVGYSSQVACHRSRRRPSK